MLDRFPAVLLRLEGAALLVASVVLYFHLDYEWWLFVVLLLAPDLAAAGYLLGPRVGAVAYDLAHFEAFPIVLGVVGVVAGSELCLRLALIWLAHIGMDRAVGYGLKYPTGFKDTHLQRV
jgi:hypothetical protein